MIAWSEAKRAENLRKHGIDLADAAHFDFDTALFDDDRDVRHEGRTRAIGFIGERLHFLVFVDEGETIRAISLRLADPREARRYANEI